MQSEQHVAFFPAKPSRTRDLIELQTAVLKATANAVVITDQTGTVIWVNSAFAQLTGYTPAHIVGQSTPSRAAADQKVATAFLNGKERFEWLHKHNDGEIFPAEVCLTALTLNGRRARGPSPAQTEVAMVSVVITSGKNEKQPLIGDQQ